MKILQIHNRYRSHGGEDAVVDAEFELLTGNGHDVIRYEVANPGSDLTAGMVLAGAPWNPFQARNVQGLVGQHRPDVVHVHNTWFSLSPAVLRAAHRAGAPVVATLHNYRVTCANGMLFRDGQPCELCLDGSSLPGIRYRCYRGLLPSAISAATISLHRRLATWTQFVDRIVALSQFAKATFITAGLPETRMLVRPNFVPDPGPRPAAAAASNTVLYVGRLSEEKGLRVLVDGWRRAQVDELELHIVGDGPLRSALDGTEASGVKLVGSQSAQEVVAAMQAARALVFPSLWYEGMPMVLVEALAAALPTMVSDLGASAEVARDLDGPWRVQPGSVAAWADALRLLRDDGFVTRGSKRARQSYEANHTPQRALMGLEGAYQEARRSFSSR